MYTREKNNLRKKQINSSLGNFKKEISWGRLSSGTCMALLSQMINCFACRDAVKDDDLILTGWEEDIFNIAKKVAEEQSPRQ